MRAFVLLIVLIALATPATAQSLQVIGYAGMLGEWGIDGYRHENGFRLHQGILRTIYDEAHRPVHSGWSGGKDR